MPSRPLPKSSEPEPVSSGRMVLASIRRGKQYAPDRIYAHGVEGVGKTKFGADSESPIFIAAEDGIRQFDVASFPEPRTFQEVLDAITVLEIERHDHRTLVLDTMDWIGHLIFDKVCHENNWSPKEFDEYGRGFKVWIADWRRLLLACDRLRAKKSMEIIALSHSQISNFKNPAGDDYMRYEPKIGGKEAPALIKEWADTVLFFNFEELTTKRPGQAIAKGVTTGKRLIYTERCAAWDAKNRYGLPPVLPLAYEEYAKARAEGYGDPAALLAECIALADKLGYAADAPLRGYLEQNKDNAEKLAIARNGLRVRAEEAGKE